MAILTVLEKLKKHIPGTLQTHTINLLHAIQWSSQKTARRGWWKSRRESLQSITLKQFIFPKHLEFSEYVTTESQQG